MKKLFIFIFILALALAVVFSLTACSGSFNFGGSSTISPATPEATQNNGSLGTSPTPKVTSAPKSTAAASTAPAASAGSMAPGGTLTLDQIKANAQAAGYTTDDGKGYSMGSTVPVNGFEFKHPDLTSSVNVLEFASESDAQAYVDFVKSNDESAHHHIQGKIAVEITIWSDDTNFTADKENQLISALFK